MDPNNDNSRHWLTYPNPKTPQYIIDIKQRLGQLKYSSTLGRPVSASNPPVQESSDEPSDQRPTSASSQKTNEHNFLTFDRRDTPDELRAARHRLDKHRYHPSLDNHPSRPQTCPVRTTTNEVIEEQIVPINKHGDAWTVESSHPFEQESTSSIIVQMVDCDGLPPEYADALETANAAQEEYQRNLKMTSERRMEPTVYRLPAMSPDSVVSQ